MSIRLRYSAILILAVLGITVSLGKSPDQKKGKGAQTAPPPAAAQSQPAPAPQVQEKIVPKPDPVEELIAKAEADYLAGMDDYNAGHLDAARAKFDHAVDLLLSGPIDLKSDERLEREFDKIVDGVYSLESQAMKEGDAFAEQKSEQAPIEEANEITFPVDPNIKAQAEAELKDTHSDLPLMITDPVASYINYFSSRGRGTLEHGLMRAGKYRAMVQRVLKEEGVPQDLIYLAQAESGFHPTAVSRAGARGMWQFMASRASEYGLERNWWIDERQDPEKSTRAAARHLKDLYNMFGDWYLAMAAYNSGPVTVQRGVQRTGYADFWELYKRNVLPAETKNYVPIIVAVTIMAKNPKQYGLEDLVTEEPIESADVVTVNYPVDLRLVAECIDASLETLQELNPSLLRLTTPKVGEFDLRLPAGTKDKYLTNIAAIPEDKRVTWRYHKVAPGETLADIARKYHATTKAISEVNALETEEIAADQRLIIPMTSSAADSEGISYSKKATRYRVRKGDTVLSVADDFGVPPEMLRKWNRIKGNDLRAGRTLMIHRPVLTSASATERKSARKSKSSKNLHGSSQRSKKASRSGSKKSRSSGSKRASSKAKPKGTGEVSEKR